MTDLGGGRVQHYGTVDSTNERALAQIASGAARHGDWHVAGSQTKGRGRRGATWQSPANEGLFASIVLLPPPRDPIQPPKLTVAAGLALLAAVRKLGLAGASLKWPNDLLVGSAKLAGILTEARGFDPERPHFVVGIGLNVRQVEFAPELTREREVTSLALQGCNASVDESFESLRLEMIRWLEIALDPEPTAARKLAHCYLDAIGLRGADVQVQLGREIKRGHLRELDFETGLELEIEGTRVQTIPLAHVTVIRSRTPHGGFPSKSAVARSALRSPLDVKAPDVSSFGDDGRGQDPANARNPGREKPDSD